MAASESTKTRTNRVFVVSANYHGTLAFVEKVKRIVPEGTIVAPIFRTYHLPELQKGDVVISDGTCKEQDEYGSSRGTYVNLGGTTRAAKAKHIFTYGFSNPVGPQIALARFRLHLALCH